MTRWTLSRLALLGWLVLCLGGMFALAAYEGRPADTSTRLTEWPKSTALEPHHHAPTVLMFLHPHCPCSRASLEQFVAALERQQVTATLVVYEPPGATPEWSHGELHALALAHPQTLRLVRDPAGQEAASFGVTTSGTCLAFGPDQKLTYFGGVTISRGHRGPNAGWLAFEQQLQNPSPKAVIYPVFGCSLANTPSRP